MHPSDGTLRRFDDEVDVDARLRGHLATCPRCAQRVEGIRADAAHAFAVLGSDDPVVDLDAARARLLGAESTPERSRVVAARPRTRRAGRVMLGVACAASASVVLVVSGGAQDFLSLFQPKQFAAVPVTVADIRSLAGLARYGSVTGGTDQLNIEAEPDATAAGDAAGVPAPAIAHLPAGVRGTATYAVISGADVSFTFNAALARAAAARAGGQLPSMPAGLDGSTLTVSIDPAVVIAYGLDLGALYSGRGLPSGGEALVVVASRTPTVSSTGVTVEQLENYLLSVPGIPAGVAAEIRALGDPAQTVPVPIPVDLASGSSVTVNGSPGLLIGDSTELGSVLLWQHNGVVYAVAGTISSDDALGVARSVR